MAEAVDKEIDELLRLGFIEPCEGSAYAGPIVVVQKRQERPRCLYVNYKRLNAATVFARIDPEPIPEAEDIMVKLAGCKYFSSADCCKGYLFTYLPVNYNTSVVPEYVSKLSRPNAYLLALHI